MKKFVNLEIITKTNNNSSIKAELCDNQFSRARGLMFRKKPERLFFVFDEEKIYPIHSFFVFFVFDAIYIDKNFRVVEIYEAVEPFSFISPKNKAMYLLEAEKGFCKKYGITNKHNIITIKN
ncbi:MAG: DUF192 domain-containing protein [Candidatus Aenigmatarchaeota archaeon]